MINCNILVSYYNNENFLKLFDLFEKSSKLIKYKGIVYNKSDHKISIKNDFATQIYLTNIGREGETYLNHIINNYDNLSEYTIFIQDDTNNHIPDYNKFINFCNNIINNKQLFALYPATWREGGNITRRKINNGIINLHTFPSKDSIKVTCQKHNINLPETYTTETCAFFICHKKSILNHKKKFYIKLRKWLLSDSKNGFVLEHIWKLIFINQ